MILVLQFIFTILASSALAESAGDQKPSPVTIQQYPSNPVPYRGAPIFDDKVFDSVGKPPAELPALESPYTGVKRTQDNSKVRFNSTQREDWIKKCSRYRDKDSKKFKECFEKLASENDRDLEERQRVVEKNLNTTFRNSQSPGPQNPAQEGSGFGGVDIKD